MIRRILKKTTTIILVAALITGSIISPKNYVKAAKSANKVLNAAMEKLSSMLPEPLFGSIGGEWAVIGLARGEYYDKDNIYFVKYYDRILKEVDRLAKSVGKDGALHRVKSTENSRLIIALSSIGIDARNVAGWDLTKPYSDFEWVKKQGINGAIFAIIALDTQNYEVDGLREKCIAEILSRELKGGGWALSGNTPDPDITAMTIQSLAKYKKTNKKVSPAIERGLGVLSSLQQKSGGYKCYGVENVESSAQVLVALTALGVDPVSDTRFIKDNHTVLDAILSYYNSNERQFSHVKNGEMNGMATEQAIYSLVSYKRFVNSKNSLYDMTDVKTAVKTGSTDNDEKDATSNDSAENIQDNNAAPVVNKDTENDAAPVVNKDIDNNAAPIVNKDTENDAAPVINRDTENDAAPVVNKDTENDAAPVVNKDTENNVTPIVNKDTKNNMADMGNANVNISGSGSDTKGKNTGSKSSKTILATLSAPRNINRGDSEFKLIVSLSDWDTLVHYKLLDAIINLPEGVDVSSVSQGSALLGGTLNWAVESETKKLRITYADLSELNDISFEPKTFPSELLSVTVNLKDVVPLSAMQFSIGGMSLKLGSDSKNASNMQLIDTSKAAVVVNYNTNEKKEVITAKRLYVGDDVDLIPKTKQAVLLQLSGFPDDVLPIFNKIVFRYNSQLTKKTGINSYLAILPTEYSMNDLVKKDNYVFDTSKMESIYFGDVNSDNVINAQDALNTLNAWLRTSDSNAVTDSEIISMNVNGDSRINTFDVLGIADFIINGNEFPVIQSAI